MSAAIVDIENGGFDKEAGIVEIGIIVIDDDYREVKRYSAIVQPYFQEGTEELMIYDDRATAIHGISVDQQMKEGKNPRVVVEEMEAIIQDHNVMEFIGHGIKRFDAPRLIKFFDRFSKYECEDRFPILTCTMEIAKEDYHCDSYSLSALCNEFNIHNTDEHRAIGDCEATHALYKKLME